MKNNILKTIILTVLIVLSLYQTTRLWFDDLSDLNLFSDIINYNSYKEEEKEEEGYYFIKPDIMATYIPQQEYVLIKKTNTQFQDIFSNSIDFLKAIISNGEIVDKEISQETIWDKTNVLLKYPFVIESDLLAKDLNIKNLDFENEIDKFNEIVIAPAMMDKYVYAYFINDNYYDNIRALKIKRRDIEKSNQNLVTLINDNESKQVLPAFISTKNLHIKLFDNNVLLPEKDLLYTDEVYLKTPFFVDDNLDSAQLEDYVNGFFKNNIKWKLTNKQDTGKITYTDESVFVYYDTKGIVEYINNDIQNRKDLSVIDSYYVAEKFINEKDKIINKQEYSLSDYSENKNENMTTFYFSYKYNDVNINIPKSYLISLDMKYPMEITVMDGQVINYKRMILELDDYIKPPEQINVDYISVIDKMLNKYPDEKSIEDMYLGYKIEYNEMNMKLEWTIITDNNIIFNSDL
ncbi:hypothetical protein SH1V18_11590 [Vallitalea longa]|uniref:Uncharacterized protein n=1 Tax=Vallitalea longa TaxID=2936439 RepID=A0A9W5Y8V7_9FIRM|nr:hypothetical protein [Vallitalea longa]GKX28679.1 hypothetical protein SH1V18_11590 [Vallitalea longa]